MAKWTITWNNGVEDGVDFVKYELAVAAMGKAIKAGEKAGRVLVDWNIEFEEER